MKMSPSNQNQVTDINITDGTGLITSTIKKRIDKYIIMTEKELYMTDSFSSFLEFFAEAMIIVGSSVLGYLINLIPTTNSIKDISLNNGILIILGLLAFICGFIIRAKKNSVIKQVLAKYKE